MVRVGPEWRMSGPRRYDAGGGKRFDEALLQRGRPAIGARLRCGGGEVGEMIGQAHVRERLAGRGQI